MMSHWLQQHWCCASIGSLTTHVDCHHGPPMGNPINSEHLNMHGELNPCTVYHFCLRSLKGEEENNKPMECSSKHFRFIASELTPINHLVPISACIIPVQTDSRCSNIVDRCGSQYVSCIPISCWVIPHLEHGWSKKNCCQIMTLYPQFLINSCLQLGYSPLWCMYMVCTCKYTEREREGDELRLFAKLQLRAVALGHEPALCIPANQWDDGIPYTKVRSLC